MKKCVKCGKDLEDDAVFCSNCGLSQQPIAKTNTKVPYSWIFIIVLIIGVSVALVPVLFPSINNQSPGEIILIGLVFFGIGMLAWYAGLRKNIDFVGRASCCLFFPVIGLIMFLYGLVALIFR